jgi:hypothetical protein
VTRLCVTHGELLRLGAWERMGTIYFHINNNSIGGDKANLLGLCDSTIIVDNISILNNIYAEWSNNT